VSTSAPGEEDVLANVAPTEGEASWVYGTVINYVVGLEPPSDGLDIADEIRPGDMIVLLLSNGGQLTFRASSLLDPPVDDAIFSQFRPGLTMVVLEEGTPSVVVTASFDTATEPDTGSAASIAVGQPVSIGDVRVVVLEGHSERTGSAQPPGTVTFLVEFSLTNLGSSALNTERFLMNLQDAAGNQYLQSPTATAHGRSGALPGSIQPGAQVGASAGYTIPETVPGPSLTWIFGPDPTSTERATIIVPYAPEVAVSTPPDVEVTQAFLAEGQSTLHIVAQIRNPGNTTVSVTASDVSLSSSGGPGELQVAAPPFPWTIEGGDTREVELQFARPAASTAAVTILGFTFEIGGLP
jgi:hypothetical protein